MKFLVGASANGPLARHDAISARPAKAEGRALCARQRAACKIIKVSLCPASHSPLDDVRDLGGYKTSSKPVTSVQLTSTASPSLLLPFYKFIPTRQRART